MIGPKQEPTFWDRLRNMAAHGGGSTPKKRTVYGTKDGAAYMFQNGALYRVRKGIR